jgi:hypothetical protein
MPRLTIAQNLGWADDYKRRIGRCLVFNDAVKKEAFGVEAGAVPVRLSIPLRA